MKTEYSSDQIESNYPDGAQRHWWFVARSRILASWIRRHASRDRPVLEVGCGRGIVVRSLREAGIDCSGVELAPVTPIAGAEGRIEAGIEAVDLEESKRNRYGTLLLLDVIEHLPEPAAFMRELAGGFPHVSRILVTVPAHEALWTNYDDRFGHLRRYTPRMLDDLSRKLGWEILARSYFYHLPYIPMWIMARLGRRRRTRLQPPRGAMSMIHRGIAWVLLADYHLLPRGLAGTSLIACFRVGRDPPAGSP